MHTPGPWKIGAREGENLPILDSAGNNLALADFAEVANNADKVEANARLIAAAPELLAALKEAHRILLAQGNTPGRLEVAGIRVAIAKAEGR